MFPYIQKHSVNNYILMYTINKAYHLYVQCRAFNQGIYVVKIIAASISILYKFPQNWELRLKDE